MRSPHFVHRQTLQCLWTRFWLNKDTEVVTGKWILPKTSPPWHFNIVWFIHGFDRKHQLHLSSHVFKQLVYFKLIGSLSRYLQGSIPPRRCRISSINSRMIHVKDSPLQRADFGACGWIPVFFSAKSMYCRFRPIKHSCFFWFRDLTVIYPIVPPCFFKKNLLLNILVYINSSVCPAQSLVHSGKLSITILVGALKINPRQKIHGRPWYSRVQYTPWKTNMTMKHPPFEDVFPIEHGDFPTSC